MVHKHDNVTFSDGWLGCFKTRHGVMFTQVCRERSNLSVDAVAKWKANQLPIFLARYEDIFNTNKSGLFYKAKPNKTYRMKQNVGRDFLPKNLLQSHPSTYIAATGIILVILWQPGSPLSPPKLQKHHHHHHQSDAPPFFVLLLLSLSVNVCVLFCFCSE